MLYQNSSAVTSCFQAALHTAFTSSRNYSTSGTWSMKTKPCCPSSYSILDTPIQVHTNTISVLFSLQVPALMLLWFLFMYSLCVFRILSILFLILKFLIIAYTRLLNFNFTVNTKLLSHDHKLLLLLYLLSWVVVNNCLVNDKH